MLCVRFDRCEPGLQKIPLMHVVRAHTGMGLADGKSVVDRLLAGEQPEVTVETIEMARDLIVGARSCGAIAVLVDDPTLAELIERWAVENAGPFEPDWTAERFRRYVERLAKIPGSGVTIETEADDDGTVKERYRIEV